MYSSANRARIMASRRVTNNNGFMNHLSLYSSAVVQTSSWGASPIISSSSLLRRRHYSSSHTNSPISTGSLSGGAASSNLGTPRSSPFFNEYLQRKVAISPVQIVPQGEVWIKEQFGKFKEVMMPGIRFLIPYVHQIPMRFPTKEIAHSIGYQTAITKDNVHLKIDGVVFFRIVDPVKAAYEITNPYEAIVQLAQTTMRAEIGKIELDKTFSERQLLNTQIVEQLQKTAEGWGVQVNRYEIMNIDVPRRISESMELEAEAERNKRKTILESMAQRDKLENIATGEKIARILNAEAEKVEQERLAEAEAFTIERKANATAQAISQVAEALAQSNGNQAVSYHIARDYIEAFSRLAKEGNTLIVPANVNDASSMIAQAVSVFGNVQKAQNQGTGMGAAAAAASNTLSSTTVNPHSFSSEISPEEARKRLDELTKIVEGGQGKDSRTTSQQNNQSSEQQV